MNYIEQLIDIGAPVVVLVLFGVLFSIQAIIKTSTDLLSFFGIETKWSLHKKQQQKSLEDHEENLIKHDLEITDLKEKLQKNNDAMVAVIRTDIIKECRRLQQEAVTSLSALDFENLGGLFESYFSLGGNHLISKLYKWFKSMPVDLED